MTSSSAENSRCLANLAWLTLDVQRELGLNEGMSMNPIRRAQLVLIVALAACFAANSVPLQMSAEAQPPAGAATSTPRVVMWDGCNSPYAPCTTYEITIYPDDRYELQGRRDVKTLGASSGQLAPGSWAKVNAALDDANFNALPARIDRKPDDPPCMTDAPGAQFRRIAADGSERSVFWSLGCRSDEMSALLNAMREAIDYEQLIKGP